MTYDPLKILLKDSEEKEVYEAGFKAGQERIKLLSKLYIQHLDFSVDNALGKWDDKERAELFSDFMNDAKKIFRLVFRQEEI